MIDVTHDRDDRGAKLHIFGFVGFRRRKRLFVKADILNGEAVFGGDEFGRFDVDGLIDRDHHAEFFHQEANDFVGLDAEVIGERSDRNRIGNLEHAFVFRGLRMGGGALGRRLLIALDFFEVRAAVIGVVLVCIGVLTAIELARIDDRATGGFAVVLIVRTVAELFVVFDEHGANECRIDRAGDIRRTRRFFMRRSRSFLVFVVAIETDFVALVGLCRGFARLFRAAICLFVGRHRRFIVFFLNDFGNFFGLRRIRFGNLIGKTRRSERKTDRFFEFRRELDELLFFLLFFFCFFSGFFVFFRLRHVFCRFRFLGRLDFRCLFGTGRFYGFCLFDIGCISCFGHRLGLRGLDFIFVGAFGSVGFISFIGFIGGRFCRRIHRRLDLGFGSRRFARFGFCPSGNRFGGFCPSGNRFGGFRIAGFGSVFCRFCRYIVFFGGFCFSRRDGRIRGRRLGLGFARRRIARFGIAASTTANADRSARRLRLRFRIDCRRTAILTL